jgi:flagellar protein FlaG
MTTSAFTASVSPARESALEGAPEGGVAAVFVQDRAALAEINQALNAASIGLQFQFAEEIGKMTANVLDVSNGKLIRTVPFEEVMSISRALGKLQGLLMHQTILKKLGGSREHWVNCSSS